MTAKLSVNVNKYALLRNSRGHNAPDLCACVDTVLAAGAHGITVHPRLDQRHIQFTDVPAISQHLRENHPEIEYNIECENDPQLIEMVLGLRPAQCTLVPVTPGEVTSDHGWDLPAQSAELRESVRRLQAARIRVSIFMDCVPENMAHAAALGVDDYHLDVAGELALDVPWPLLATAQVDAEVTIDRYADRLRRGGGDDGKCALGVELIADGAHDEHLPVEQSDPHASGILEVSI